MSGTCGGAGHTRRLSMSSAPAPPWTQKQDGHQRDLFPLPRLARPVHADRAASRAVVQRRLRFSHTTDWANAGIDVLNRMSGGVPDISSTAGPSGAQRIALDRIRSTYVSVGKPPENADSAEEALSELLHSAATYTGSGSKVQPYAKELISWPPAGSAPDKAHRTASGGRPSAAFGLGQAHASGSCCCGRGARTARASTCIPGSHARGGAWAATATYCRGLLLLGCWASRLRVPRRAFSASFLFQRRQEPSGSCSTLEFSIVISLRHQRRVYLPSQPSAPSRRTRTNICTWVASTWRTHSITWRFPIRSPGGSPCPASARARSRSGSWTTGRLILRRCCCPTCVYCQWAGHGPCTFASG